MSTVRYVMRVHTLKEFSDRDLRVLRPTRVCLSQAGRHTTAVISCHAHTEHALNQCRSSMSSSPRTEEAMAAEAVSADQESVRMRSAVHVDALPLKACASSAGT